MTDAIVEQVGDSLEELIDAGIAASEEIDTRKWVLGDLAARVEKAYGEDRIGEYAKAIKVKVVTLRGYKRVSQFYPDVDIRQKSETLSWSHYREAMRLKDLEQALVFLEECATEALTVEAAGVELVKRLGKPVPPRKLFEGVVPWRVYGNGQVVFAVPNENFDIGKGRVRVVIYEEAS